jgi:hypothetical protein
VTNVDDWLGARSETGPVTYRASNCGDWELQGNKLETYPQPLGQGMGISLHNIKYLEGLKPGLDSVC